MATTSMTTCCAARAPRITRARQTRQRVQGAADPIDAETATPIVASADDPATLIAAAEALTNPPEFEALSTLLGRIALAKLDPLPERQVIARIKSATGIGISVLTQQLAELRRRVNVTGDPHAPIPKPAWFRRLRLDLAGAPERNEANVIVALTSDPAFAGVLAFDEFAQKIVVRQPLPWDSVATSLPRPWEDADDIRAAEWLQLRRHQRGAGGREPRCRRRRPRTAHPSRPRLARHPDMGRHAPDRELDEHLSRR